MTCARLAIVALLLIGCRDTDSDHRRGASPVDVSEARTALPRRLAATTQPTTRGLIGQNLRDLKPYSGRILIDAGKQGEEPTQTADGLRWSVIVDNAARGTPAYNGVYSVTASEPIDFKITGGSPAKITGAGQMTLSVTQPQQTPQLHLLFPGRTALPKGIRVIRPGYTAADADRDVFTREYLAMMARFNPGVIRAMGWQRTNGSTQTTWDGRCRVTDALWGRKGIGGPIEPLIALCNALGADLWLNVPHLADDGWCYNAAVLCRDGLNSGLRLWLEYSNEVWNTAASIGEQTAYAKSQGDARAAAGDRRYDGANSTIRARQFYAFRAAECGGIFRTVFAAKGQSDRVSVVLAGQASYPEQLQWSVDTLRKNGLLDSVDALSGAGYFGDDPALRNTAGLTTDTFLAPSPNGAEPLLTRMARQTLRGPKFAAFFNLCRDTGKLPVCYEWSNGQTLKGSPNVTPALAQDQRIAGVFQAWADEWFGQGGNVANHELPLSSWDDGESLAAVDEVSKWTDKAEALATLSLAHPLPMYEPKPDPVIVQLKAERDAAIQQRDKYLGQVNAARQALSE